MVWYINHYHTYNIGNIVMKCCIQVHNQLLVHASCQCHLRVVVCHITLFVPQNEAEIDPMCYVRVADAACEAGDVGNTVKYCQEARKRGLSPGDRAIALAEGVADGSATTDEGGSVIDADSDGNLEPSQRESSGVVTLGMFLLAHR